MDPITPEVKLDYNVKTEADQTFLKIKTEVDEQVKVDDPTSPVNTLLIQAEQWTPAKRKRVALDPTGDAFFRIGSKEFRVSTKVLSLASTAFDRMFKTVSHDGVIIHKVGPYFFATILVLPDEIASMRDLLSLLYQNWDAVTPRMKVKELWRVIKVAERFACVETIKPWALPIFLSHLASSSAANSDHMTRLLYPAFALDHVPGFYTITRNLIRGNYPPYPAFYGTSVEDFGEGVPDLLPSGLLRKPHSC